MKILILGANGFIGKNVFNYLNSIKNYKILAPNRNELNLLQDIECEVYLSTHKPDFIIHSAVDINSVENSLKIFFNIYNNHKYYGSLIQLGSGAEYDRRNYSPKMSEYEFGKSVPIDTYGLSKYLISREIICSKRLNLINLRLFGVFGNYEDSNRRFISNNISRVLSGLPVSLNKNMLFDYLHVDDLCKLLVILFDKMPLKDCDYNFCTGAPIYLKDIGLIIQELMHQKEKIIINENGLNSEYSGNPSKLLNEIGGFEFTPLKDSIQKLISFYNGKIGKI